MTAAEQQLGTCDRCGMDDMVLYPCDDVFAHFYHAICEACEMELERHAGWLADAGKRDE